MSSFGSSVRQSSTNLLKNRMCILYDIYFFFLKNQVSGIFNCAIHCLTASCHMVFCGGVHLDMPRQYLVYILRTKTPFRVSCTLFQKYVNLPQSSTHIFKCWSYVQYIRPKVVGDIYSISRKSYIYGIPNIHHPSISK